MTDLDPATAHMRMVRRQDRWALYVVGVAILLLLTWILTALP